VRSITHIAQLAASASSVFFAICICGCGFTAPDGGGSGDAPPDRPNQPSSEVLPQDEGDSEPVDLSDFPSFGGGETPGQPVRFRLPLAADPQDHTFFDNDLTRPGISDWRCESATYDGHPGTDFPVPKNTPVYAAADGVIIQKVDMYGDGCYPCTDPCGPSYPAANRCQAPNGNFVRLRHATVGGKYVSSVYNHLEKGSVTPKPEGASVSCGELIGRVGRSGSATGYHLHFQTQLVDSNGIKSPFDPYAGPCGAESTWWVSQTSSGPGTSCPSVSPVTTPPPPPPPPPGCPNGVCGAGENCANCPQDCGCPTGKQCVGTTCQDIVTCPDGSCGSGENCANCPQDCACPTGQQCVGTTCQNIVTCPDGSCGNGENCANCPQDCGCPSGQECRNGSCGLKCPNGTCDPGETCSSCPQDCGCPAGQECRNGSCGLKCPNGTCDPGETCSSCAQDCGCPAGQECRNGSCGLKCPNGTCDPGETCSSCPQDCGCPAGQECRNGSCGLKCPNATCDPGETCSSCPQDCACQSGQECANGACRNRCGNQNCDAQQGENCSTCPGDCACQSGQECANGACRNRCGNQNCDTQQGENCSTCPGDCACQSGQECANGACRNRCGNQNCDAQQGENCANCPQDCACSSGQQCESSTCKPTGACCVNGNSCSTSVSQTTCTNQGGVWQGNGSTGCTNCPPHPRITNVLPSPAPGSRSPTTMTIQGSGFLQGARLWWYDVTHDVIYTDTPGTYPTSVSSTQITAKPTFGPYTALWSVTVLNPGDDGSNEWYISVTAP